MAVQCGGFREDQQRRAWRAIVHVETLMSFSADCPQEPHAVAFRPSLFGTQVFFATQHVCTSGSKPFLPVRKKGLEMLESLNAHNPEA